MNCNAQYYYEEQEDQSNALAAVFLCIQKQ